MTPFDSTKPIGNPKAFLAALLLALAVLSCNAAPEVEIIRDEWGIPHIFAENENAGFFGLGYVSAEDRILQMEIWRRRASGRLAETFGPNHLEHDRKFRVAGLLRHANESFEASSEEMKGWLRSYAAGVNAWIAEHPEVVKRRFASLSIEPAPWTAADPLLSMLAVADLFDKLFDEGAVTNYRQYVELVEKFGETKALEARAITIDEEFVAVPESEMAKDTEVYARLKARERTPAFLRRDSSGETLKFSHAWVLGGDRSATGKPILESEPRISVTNPSFWYEYHLSAGRFDARGISMPGVPGVLIGFNRDIALGGTALGAGSTVTFLDKLSNDGKGFVFDGETLPFARRLEQIEVKGGAAVVQEVLTNRHGFVFNAFTSRSRTGEAYVSHYKAAHDRGNSVRSFIERMAARNWSEFLDSVESYYVPGLHMLYGDVKGNIGYATVAHVPLTRRSRRMALEGWTGEDEVLGRVPWDEMPRMFNPDAGFIGNGNNRPVGAWYPYDLGIQSTGTGSRAWRVHQLIEGDRKFSVEELEAEVHRDDMHAATSALLPVARKVAKEEGVDDQSIRSVLEATEDWDFHFRTSDPAFRAAAALAATAGMAFRRSGLKQRFGLTEAGACHLGRLLSARFQQDQATPKDPKIRNYLLRWLRVAGQRLAQAGDSDPAIYPLPYQGNARMGLPSVEPAFDAESPHMEVIERGSIWSPTEDGYSQIVDLDDIDNSRAMIAPGVSEDPESPFYLNQMDLWSEGKLRPAPLSRHRIEELAVSSESVTVRDFSGQDLLAERTVDVAPEGTSFLPAIPGAGEAAGRHSLGAVASDNLRGTARTVFEGQQRKRAGPD